MPKLTKFVGEAGKAYSEERYRRQLIALRRMAEERMRQPRVIFTGPEPRGVSGAERLTGAQRGEAERQRRDISYEAKATAREQLAQQEFERLGEERIREENIQKNRITELYKLRGSLGLDREFDEAYQEAEETVMSGRDPDWTSLHILAGTKKAEHDRAKREAADKKIYVQYEDPETGEMMSTSIAGYKARFLDPIDAELKKLDDDEKRDQDEKDDFYRDQVMGRLKEKDEPDYYIKREHGSQATFEGKRRRLEEERNKILQRMYPSRAVSPSLAVYSFDDTVEFFMKKVEKGEIDQAWIDAIKSGDKQAFNFLIQQNYDPFEIQKQLFRLGK